MKLVIPVNGDNKRMGKLFKCPKHLLTIDGVPVIVLAIKNMIKMLPIEQVIVLSSESNYNQLVKVLEEILIAKIVKVQPTESHVDTLFFAAKHLDIDDQVFFMDSDIVPMEINTFDSSRSTVFCFSLWNNGKKNEYDCTQYSNFGIKENGTIETNEKEKRLDAFGAGLYYFHSSNWFFEICARHSLNNVSAVYRHITEPVDINTSSVIKRCGTLKDLKYDNQC